MSEKAKLAYEIHTDSLTEAVASLVAALKAQDPGIGKFEAVCLDGSKVTIRIAKGGPVRHQWKAHGAPGSDKL